MNREILKMYNAKTEVVYDETGKIVFAKAVTTHQGYQVGSDMTTVSGFGVLTDPLKDVGFTHLEAHDFPQGAVVDYQYIDGKPENELSDAKIGTLKVYDREGNLVSGESFSPNGFTRIVEDGKLVADPNGISMSAPKTVKDFIGKNISEIKIQENTVGMHR